MTTLGLDTIRLDFLSLDNNIEWKSLNNIHFHVVQTCVSKPKQLSLPVVLFPKKGANKYSQHVYSLSATLQHSHLLVLEIQDLTVATHELRFKEDWK